jgi:N-methylhydantoinase B
LGVTLEFQVFAPDANVIARGMDRTRFDPWGAHGGLPGARMLPAVINPGTERERRIRKINFLRLVPGDTVKITTSGGGGYGDPLERDPERVRLDVELGFVSREAAENLYGCVFDSNGNVDEDAVAKRRRELRASRKGAAPRIFSLGEAREKYDALWSAEAQDALNSILVALPILVRYRIKNEFHKALYDEARDRPITREEIAQCWDGLRPRFYPPRYLADQFQPKVKSDGPAAN